MIGLRWGRDKSRTGMRMTGFHPGQSFTKSNRLDYGRDWKLGLESLGNDHSHPLDSRISLAGHNDARNLRS